MDPGFVSTSNTTSESRDRSITHLDGLRAHLKLGKFIKKRLGKNIDLNLVDENQLKEFVKTIEECFEFKIKNSELMIHGYASHKQTNETIHWSGQIDAIGVKKDGTIIVVDWKLCKGLLSEFWDHADDFSRKLHQTMIYWKLVKAHYEYFYREEKVPMVDILLVPMSSSANITDGDPRICHDFRALQDNGFFNIIDEYHWTVQRPRRKGSSPRCEH